MTTAPTPVRPAPSPVQPVSIRPLALAEARRFARHPLFLFGVAVDGLVLVVELAQQTAVSVVPLEDTVFSAFLLGVVGFVVAHRLTTSFNVAEDLPGTSPTDEHRRTLALLLACLVPFGVGILEALLRIGFGVLWPPEPLAPANTVAWFADSPDLPLLAAFAASLPMAALGGPLLGVAVARWLPFRGSALLGTVLLVVGSAYGDALPGSWFAASPWANMGDSLVLDGVIRGSWLREGVSQGWHLLYIVCLCGLAAVTALLRDGTDRRRLTVVGGALAALAVVSLALAMG